MLIEKLYSPEFLYKAWDGINKYNTESYGLSGETISSFKSQIEVRIPIIAEQISKGNYKFSPTRAYVIPKDNGKFRPLQIPEVADRVVLKAIAMILESELSALLKDGEGVSFAYQKGLGIQDAVQKIKEYYNTGNTYVLEADIENFFPTVDRKLLLSLISKNLKDDSLMSLIEKGLSQEVCGLDRIDIKHHHLFPVSNNGIPQGNPLSPLFSNIFLAPFDLKSKKKKLLLIRYADDFIVMCKSELEAKQAFSFCKSILEDELGLKLHELGKGSSSKTKILQPHKEDFSFLSVSFDGKIFFPSIKCKNNFLRNIEKICNSKHDAVDVLTILRKIRNSLDGWVSTFSFTDDVQRYFLEIDTLINQQMLIALRRFNWKLSTKSLGKVPAKFRKNSKGRLDSGECLSLQQRKMSGVPLCLDILKERKLPK